MSRSSSRLSRLAALSLLGLATVPAAARPQPRPAQVAFQFGALLNSMASGMEPVSFKGARDILAMERENQKTLAPLNALATRLSAEIKAGPRRQKDGSVSDAEQQRQALMLDNAERLSDRLDGKSAVHAIVSGMMQRYLTDHPEIENYCVMFDLPRVRPNDVCGLFGPQRTVPQLVAAPVALPQPK